MRLGSPSVPPHSPHRLPWPVRPAPEKVALRPGALRPNRASVDTEEAHYAEWAGPHMLSMLIVPPPAGHSCGNHKDLGFISSSCRKLASL